MKIIIPILLIGGILVASCKVRQVTALQNLPYPAFDREAHRGGRGLMPENTIPAMLNAIDLGVETIEMDTHITADNEVVLSHDDYVNPLFSLSASGQAFTKNEALKYVFYKMSYAEIAKFDVGSKYYDKFPKQKKIKVTIPLLAEVIDSVQHYLKSAHKKQVFYNIETKSSQADDYINNPDPETFVKLLMEVINNKKIAPWVIIQSFDKRTLQVLHRRYPHIRTSYLVDKKAFQENMNDLGFKPFIYSPTYKLVTKALVDSCHQQGIKVVPWTVNTQQEIAALKAIKVDGIISDYPNLLMLP